MFRKNRKNDKTAKPKETRRAHIDDLPEPTTPDPGNMELRSYQDTDKQDTRRQ